MRINGGELEGSLNGHFHCSAPFEGDKLVCSNSTLKYKLLQFTIIDII